MPFPQARGSVATTLDAVRHRVLARVAEKFDPARVKRMPPSIVQQEVKRTIEQAVEHEGARLSRPDRESLIDDLLREVIGYGPLEELFCDPNVQEVLVLNYQSILARKGDQGWLPTNVKFRDAEHLRQVLSKASTQADVFGGDRQPTAGVDGKLGNGFRILAVVPPTVLDLPPYVLFHRSDARASGTIGMAALTRTPTPTSQGSGGISHPAPRDPASEVIQRLKARITEHILTRLGPAGAAAARKLDVRELQKAVAAYVTEFCESEAIRLTEANEARLILEIMTAIRP